MSRASGKRKQKGNSGCIDFGAFPDIVERVVRYAPAKAIPALRATCRAIRDQLDSLMIHDVVVMTEEHPSDDWLLTLEEEVWVCYRIPGIVVAHLDKASGRIIPISSLNEWIAKVNKMNEMNPNIVYSTDPTQASGSARSYMANYTKAFTTPPLAATRSLGILGHVPVRAIAAVLAAAPNLEVTWYTPGPQGVSAVATGTPVVIVNNFLTSPDGSCEEAVEFNYISPAVDDTRKIVRNLHYDPEDKFLTQAGIAIGHFPDCTEEIVFRFCRKPDILKVEEEQAGAAKKRKPRRPAQGARKSRRIAASKAPARPATICPGILTDIVIFMALSIKIKAMTQTTPLRFKFVGTDEIDIAVFGLDLDDDLEDMLCNSVEEASGDPFDPNYPALDGSMSPELIEQLRIEDNIIMLTSEEYEASLSSYEVEMERWE